MLGCCLNYFHFLWAILNTSTVQVSVSYLWRRLLLVENVLELEFGVSHPAKRGLAICKNLSGTLYGTEGNEGGLPSPSIYIESATLNTAARVVPSQELRVEESSQ